MEPITLLDKLLHAIKETYPNAHIGKRWFRPVVFVPMENFNFAVRIKHDQFVIDNTQPWGWRIATIILVLGFFYLAPNIVPKNFNWIVFPFGIAVAMLIGSIFRTTIETQMNSFKEYIETIEKQWFDKR